MVVGGGVNGQKHKHKIKEKTDRNRAGMGGRNILFDIVFGRYPLRYRKKKISAGSFQVGGHHHPMILGHCPEGATSEQ